MALAVSALLTAAGPLAAAHTPIAWFDTICSGTPPEDRCWQPIPSLNNPVRDLTAAQGDASKQTAPNPSSADIWSGANNTLNSVYFGYDDNGTTTADDDVMFFRMRLLDTPAIGGVDPPDTAATGPYDANTTWNFILDLNGDGWSDYVNTTDGKSGKPNPAADRYDDMFLARNTSTTRQDLTNLSNCTAGGQMLWTHDSTDPATDSCASNTAIPCDFKFTRVVNDTANGGGYFLDMQFPLSSFDACSGSDTDGDGIGGAQLMTPTTPFIFCATTSTQPQDPSNKDLGANGTFEMRNTRRLPCGDPCTLSGGCTQPPVLVDLTRSCSTGTNGSPITLTATVLDTLVPNGSGDDVVDTINNVTYYYRQDGTPTSGSWVQAAAAGGSANPVTSPNSGTLNLWSMQWDTSSLATSPTSLYWIRVDVTDDDGNVTSTVPMRIDLTNCSTVATPVTLASFRATPEGGELRLQWSTATETGNLGFNVYGETARGWERLNRQLVRSHAVDSLEPQHYEQRVPASRLVGHELYVEDVDIRGETRMHGPFGVGRDHGKRPEVEAVDWQAVRHAMTIPASGPRPARAAAQKGTGGGGSYPAIRLLVDRAGLHRLTYEAMAAAGFDWTGAPLADIALLGRGVPVPVRVEGAGSFGPGAFVEFRGEALDTLYTGTAAYELRIDRASAKRPASDNGPAKGKASETAAWYLETATVERDRVYSFASPNGDPWFDTAMFGFTTPLSWSFDLAVDGLVAGAAPASLAVALWGVTNFPLAPDHHLQVRLNGAPVADDRFDGLVTHQVSAQLPAGALHDGANTLELRLPGDSGTPYDLVHLESYAVTYPRALAARDGRLTFSSAGRFFRVTGLPSPDVVVYRAEGSSLARLAKIEVAADGGGYAVSFGGSGKTATYLVAAAGAFHTPGMAAVRDGAAATAAGEARYLIVSHPAFLDGLGPLVAARTAQGLSVRVVNVDDVYARFGHGVFDAQAIRDYVAWAAANLGTEYVLLVGGDTYDYRNFLGSGSISFIPSLYGQTGTIVRYAPADALYADLDGDGVQDLAIGRFPVRTAAELDSVVAKTLAYEAKGYPRTAVFAADGFDAAGNVSFSEISDRFAARLPAGWTADTAYIDALGIGGARGALLAAIERGTVLTSYIGHSGSTLWSFTGLFTAADAAALGNAGWPTIVSQWGCWNTYYVVPTYNTMAHKLLLSGDRGAAAVMGASTLTAVESDEAFGALLTPLLVQRGTTLGHAIVTAKQRLAAAQPGLADVLLGWTLLGDPALAIDP
jgi:hypothetical protein